ncbi:unnamed protein product, partial [Cladocopium goreaui]
MSICCFSSQSWSRKKTPVCCFSSRTWDRVAVCRRLATREVVQFITHGYDTYLGSELDRFRERFPMDECAFDYLSKAATEVQTKVLQNFRPKNQDHSFCDKLLQQEAHSNDASKQPPPPCKRTTYPKR